MEVSKNLNVMEVIYGFELAGSERVAALISEQLKASGCNVSLCATHTGKGPLSDFLEERDISCYAANMEKRSKYQVLFFLYLLFRRKKINVLHVHHLSMFRLCYWPAKLAGVKRMIVTEHSNYLTGNNKRLEMLAYKYSMKADMLTVIHSGLMDYFTNDLGVCSDKIKIIHNGVDVDKFTIKEKDFEFKRSINVDDNAVLLGFVGRFHPAKDLGMMVHALKILIDMELTRPVALVMVGDGDLRDEIESLSRELGVREFIRFLGVREDIPYILNNLDVFLLSSKTEGLPMVILEAMSSGVPCVATNVGGISEVIYNGNGFLSAAGDSKAFADNLYMLVESLELRKKMSGLARQSVVEKFSLQKMMASYHKVLFDK
ncbi:MAG: glycosyltransferase [Gammaproteobacteria bacterium]|nr:glycosyltransferase [Gammaproteobacteria bacterium]